MAGEAPTVRLCCILLLPAYGTAVRPLPNPSFNENRRKKIPVSNRLIMSKSLFKLS